MAPSGLTLGPEGPAGPAAPWSPEGPCGRSEGGRLQQAQPQQSLRVGSGVPWWPQRPPKEPHPAAGLSAETPKPTYGGAGKTLQSGEAAVALQPSLSSLSSLTFVTARPLGTLGEGKGPRQARGDRPLPKAPRTPYFTHGTCQRAQHHSPACLERQQDRRDPWALVHPAGRKEGVKRSRDGGRAKRCQHPETPTASGPGFWGFGGASEPAPGTTLLFPALLASVTVKKKSLNGA